VLQREEVLSKRNIAYHLLEGAGFLMASFTPYFSEPNPKAHFATASSIVSGALLQVFAVVSPDRVPGQLNNLDDESLRDGSVIANNTQVRTTIFVEKRNLTEALQEAAKEFDGEQKSATGIASFRSTINASASEGSFIHAKSESPFLVRKALGDLILVGDPIDYLPRVQIQSNASQPSSTVSLSPASLNFTKGTKDQKVTLTNTGSGPLTINSVKVGGDTEHFSVTSNPCGSTLAAGANCVITVSFNAPSTVGLLNATLNIDDSASGSPHIVNLSGTEPSVALSTTSLSLPNQTVKTVSSSQKVTLTNTGTGPLTISGITFDGANENIFSLDKTPADACNTTTAVPVQGSCGIYVLVTPSAKGSFSATLSVADDAGDSPQKVSLSGTSQ